MEEQFLGVRLVLEADLVEAAAALAGVALQRRLRRLARQRIGRPRHIVVHAAGHDRPVRVALPEIDDHLLADPRQQHAAPLGSGPALSDTYPARTVLVGLAAAVPMNPDLLPAALVALNPFAHRAYPHPGHPP